MMQWRESENRRRIGSVKEAINSYGEKILDGTSLKNPSIQMDSPETSSRTIDLHVARRDIFRFKESRVAAEDTKVQAEFELSNAKKTVKDLSVLIEESNSKVKAKMRDMEAMKKPARREGQAFTDNHNAQYEVVMRELEHIKQEVSKLKIDMASVLQEKSQAVRESEASRSKMLSYLSSAEALRMEIEEASEEQVIVELARIEALKEYGAIQANREKEAEEFLTASESAKKKIKDLKEEIDQSKEVEAKLAVTMSDVDVLQSELKLVKEKNKKVQRLDSSKKIDSGEDDSSNLLQAVTGELEAAKKELAAIKEEGFQFMTSMDIIRNELIHVTQETSRLKKSGEKADMTVQNLNSKLLRAKAKLESASAAEEQTKMIANNLSITLDQLRTEVEASRKEKSLICEETAVVKAEIEKTEAEIDRAEERLEASIQELEAVKLSEAMALESLKSLIENTIRARASAAENSSSITISKFEYDYLTGRATGAEEIADKKVAAAQAWIEALKASEKEMLMKTEIAQREVREKRVGQEDNKSSKSRRQGDNMQLVLPRKSMKDSGNATPARRAKLRKSSSPGGRYVGRSASLTIKHRQKVMPNLAKFFGGNKGTEKGL